MVLARMRQLKNCLKLSRLKWSGRLRDVIKYTTARGPRWAKVRSFVKWRSLQKKDPGEGKPRPVLSFI